MKLRNIVLINVGIAAALSGSIYLFSQVRSQQNKRKSDGFYRDARDSFSEAAALKDADAAQFDPKYVATLAAIKTLKAFNDHSFLGENQIAASQAIGSLELCVSTLQAYRLPIPTDLNVPAVKLRLTRIVDHCVVDGRTGSPSDTK